MDRMQMQNQSLIQTSWGRQLVSRNRHRSQCCCARRKSHAYSFIFTLINHLNGSIRTYCAHEHCSVYIQAAEFSIPISLSHLTRIGSGSSQQRRRNCMPDSVVDREGMPMSCIERTIIENAH